MRRNFEKEDVHKWCESKMKTESDSYDGQWIRSHVRFLRAGDRFCVADEVFMATSGPIFVDTPPRVEMPSLFDIAKDPELIKELQNPKKFVGYWTINFVVER